VASISPECEEEKEKKAKIAVKIAVKKPEKEQLQEFSKNLQSFPPT
jgi:hypothetical protein